LTNTRRAWGQVAGTDQVAVGVFGFLAGDEHQLGPGRADDVAVGRRSCGWSLPRFARFLADYMIAALLLPQPTNRCQSPLIAEQRPGAQITRFYSTK
jgi:hypothetical protein